MNKSLLQKKFRFVMIIAALVLFITIVTPTYINKSSSNGYPKVIWMWAVLFGAGGGNKLDPSINFNWFAFIGYSMAVVLLIISLARKFISLDAEDKKGNGGVVVDVICMLCCLISLIMFIILPFSLTNGLSTEANAAYAISNFYAWLLSYILIYIIMAVMFVSSMIVVYAETILKIKKIREKKAKEENKE